MLSGLRASLLKEKDSKRNNNFPFSGRRATYVIRFIEKKIYAHGLVSYFHEAGSTECRMQRRVLQRWCFQVRCIRGRRFDASFLCEFWRTFSIRIPLGCLRAHRKRCILLQVVWSCIRIIVKSTGSRLWCLREDLPQLSPRCLGKGRSLALALRRHVLLMRYHEPM